MGEPAVLRRLAELGLTLPDVVAPLAAYRPAIEHAGIVQTAGQLPFRDGALLVTGRLGEDVSEAEGIECARQCALNALAAVASVADLDRVERVLTVTGYVASAAGFTAQPAVLNGASELLGQVFGEAGAHARSAVGVAALPLGAPVEVQVSVALRG